MPPSGEVAMTSFPASKKPQYLGFDTCWSKSYHWPQIGSWCWSFRVHYQKLFTAPPSGGTATTSFPAAGKSQYLGKNARWSKSCHWRQIGSWCRSFRIHHRKLFTVPPSEEIAMTSYPASMKTSISRKWCVLEQKLPLTTNRKLVSICQNPSLKTVYGAP